MSQPQEERARVQQEEGSQPSPPHHTPYEDTTDRGVVEEKGMDIAAPPPPVKAVVLSLPNTEATSGEVLISKDDYETYIGPRNEKRAITSAGHLAKAAKARAVSAFSRWEFEGVGRVYDYNPTDKPLKGLKGRRPFNLQLREDQEELDNDIVLRGHQDPDTQQVVDTFFVLLTAFKKQAERKVDALPESQLSFGRVKPSAFALCLFSKGFETAVAEVVEVAGGGLEDTPDSRRADETRIADLSVTLKAVPPFDMKSDEADAEPDRQPDALQPEPEDLQHDGDRTELAAEQRQVLPRGKYTVISLQLQDGEPVYWMDNIAYGSRLIVRSCYERLWEIITTAPQRRFVISGSPGIGKSWFLFFCMYKLAVDETPFLYIVDKGRDTTFYLFIEGQREMSYFPTARVDSLLSNEAAYVLIDDRPPFGMVSTLCKVIVSSSPDRDTYKHFLNEPGDLVGLQYFMPVWSDEELAVKNFVPTNARHARLSTQQLEELVRIAGRVPRYIFHHDSFERAAIWNKKTIAEAVQRKRVKQMLDAARNLTSADKETSLRILAIEVDERTFYRTGVGFHSPYTKQVVFDQLMNASNAQLFDYCQGTWGSLKGNICEWYAHRQLANGARMVVKCLENDDPRSTLPSVELEVPHANNEVPAFQRTELELLCARANDYLVSTSAIFEAVDSICLPRFLLEVTVRRTHPIKLHRFATFLINLSSREEKPIQGEIPFIFIVRQEELDGFGNQPFEFCGTKRTAVRDMEQILHEKISEAERAVESRAAEKAMSLQASGQAKKKRARPDGAIDYEDDRAAKAFDKLQEKAALARLILEHRLLHRIKRYAWSI